MAYEGLEASVGSTVNVQMGLLVKALVTTRHVALVPLLALLSGFRVHFLLEGISLTDSHLLTMSQLTSCGAGRRFSGVVCLDWMAFMSVSTSVLKLMPAPPFSDSPELVIL